MTSAALLLVAGAASAQTTAPAAAGASVTHHVLGVPLGTATWALFGLTVLIGGLFAASRSGHQAATAGATDSVLRASAKSDPKATESVSDFGRSVSAA